MNWYEGSCFQLTKFIVLVRSYTRRRLLAVYPEFLEKKKRKWKWATFGVSGAWNPTVMSKGFWRLYIEKCVSVVRNLGKWLIGNEPLRAIPIIFQWKCTLIQVQTSDVKECLSISPQPLPLVYMPLGAFTHVFEFGLLSD